jgi:hypothetical protein
MSGARQYRCRVNSGLLLGGSERRSALPLGARDLRSCLPWLLKRLIRRAPFRFEPEAGTPLKPAVRARSGRWTNVTTPQWK